MKKLISIIITISMLLSSVHAFAISGEGTESNPYLISSVSDITKIHNDLGACYRLTANIDMSNADFEPIGNEWEGPFTGTIDGAGYTISNLNINLTDNKYVGFVGYLDGCVKNLHFNNVTANGYKYVGVVAGYADENSVIRNCTISCDISAVYQISTPYIGGIVGCNKGRIDNCSTYGNVFATSNVYASSSYAAGITGYNSGTIENCYNEGTISSEKRSCNAGGIVGINYGTIDSSINKGEISSNAYEKFYTSSAGGIASKNRGTITMCSNYGSIKSQDTHTNASNLGGIAGSAANGTIVYCVNYGNIENASVDCVAQTGGILADANSDVTIYKCINYGNVYASSNINCVTGGIAGSITRSTIKECLNNGNITIKSTISNSSYKSVGGIVGYTFNDSVGGTVNNNINNGVINPICSDIYVYAGGIIGHAYYGTATECIDLGDIVGYTNKILGSSTWKSNNYQLNNLCNSNYGTSLSVEQFTIPDSFTDMNHDVWFFDPNTNNGFPQLRDLPKHLTLNKSVEVFDIGSSDKLCAYLDGENEGVIWFSNDTSVATVSSNGFVTASGLGTAMITATNSEGMKANCLIYVYGKADSINLNKISTSIAVGATQTLTYVQNPYTANETVLWSSNDESVVSVDQGGKVTAIKKGTAVITATTSNSGISTSCTVTVTGNPITSVSLSPASTTMNVGETKTLTTSISPAQYAGALTWNSTNADVATVDNNGTITAKAPGTTVISVTSDTNKTAQCTVTVKAPIKEISFSKPEITIVKGYTEKLVPIISPTNTTDTLSWLSSSTSYASVSSDGTVTANRVGTTTITVTASSGKKAYCVVNVVNPTTPVSSVTIDKSEVILTKTDTVQLNATVLPSDATNKELTWTTTDESIASVNDNGIVTANGVGIATITATSNNGMYHECIIKVVSASGPSIVLTPENAIPNAISKVKASIVRNPGISGYKFTIKYDEALLTPVSVTANEEFGGTLTTNLDDANRTEFNVVWYSNGDTDIDINGELFTIDFKVAETAELGDYSDISIEYGAKDICNTAGENIALYTESAKVTVEEPLPGDIYEDGDVNVYDLTLLARHMIGLADFTDRQLEAANVTDDELVDIKDVVKLAQYVVGWTGIELMSLMSLSAEIPETPTVTVGTASVNDANEADIPIYIKNNTGIAAYRFVLDYNEDDIEIVGITPSDFINPENFGTNLAQENDEGLIVFCYQEGNAVADGELFTVKVRYKNPTDTSVSPISIKSAENNFCNQAIENVAINYETGYALGDDYIVANKVVSDTNFSCELYFDDSYAEQSAKAIIAFYDGNGRMVQLMPKDITVKPGKVDLSIDYDKKAYATYKLMIWEGLNSLKPLVEAR